MTPEEMCDYTMPSTFIDSNFASVFVCTERCDALKPNFYVPKVGEIPKTPNCVTLIGGDWPAICLNSPSFSEKCGNGVIDFNELCDGHFACNIDCKGYDTVNWFCKTVSGKTVCSQCGNNKLDGDETCDKAVNGV